jgi:hypothetical protein
MTPKADIAVVGLAVMGRNLVLNMSDHGYRVVAFNRTQARVPGDIIIDGGNSLFEDTARRTRQVEPRPALRRHRRQRRRAGRTARAQHHAGRLSRRPGRMSSRIFQAIAAKVDGGTPCCDWVGERRRRPLREDGPQRHRVRRHAAHLRGLPAHEGRPRHERGADARGLRATGTAASSRAT